MTELTVITRQGCHLCSDALVITERVAAATGASLTVIDFDAAEPGTLPARFSDQLPVTLIDGREHDHFKVDEARLRAALTASGAPQRRRWLPWRRAK